MYFRLRSGRSSQRGTEIVRWNTSRPLFQSHSDTVPTGQIQLQKAFR